MKKILTIISFFIAWCVIVWLACVWKESNIKNRYHNSNCIISQGKILSKKFKPSYEFSYANGINEKSLPAIVEKYRDSIVPDQYIFTIKGICNEDTVIQDVNGTKEDFSKYKIGDTLKFNLN